MRLAVTIRTRLMIGYAGVGVLLLLIAGIGAYSRHVLFEGLNRTEVVARNIYDIQQLAISIEKIIMPPNDYLISGDIAEKKRYEAKLEELMKVLERLRESGALMNDQDLANDLESELNLLNGQTQDIFSISPVKRTEGTELMHALDKTGGRIYQLLSDHAEKEREELRSLTETRKRIVSRVNYFMIGGAAAALILGTLLIIYLERSISVPLNNLSEGVKKLNGGKWEKVEIEDGIEITALANEYNKMVERLRTAYETLEDTVKERTLELSEMNKKLELLAKTDGLTGLYNHRQFYESLTAELGRASRYGNVLSLIMIDIDYFKLYNDQFGHLAGDAVLKEVASVMANAVRDVDIVARYGGEEFAVIAPEAGKGEGMMFADRIRDLIAAHPFSHKEGQPGGKITISCGVASYPEDGTTVRSLIKAADNALYRAKGKGRNMVEAASPENGVK